MPRSYKPRDIPCPRPSCTKMFTNYAGLKVHVRSIHDRQEWFLRYQCTVNWTPTPERDSTDNDCFFGAGGGTPPRQASRASSRAGSPSDEHHHAHEDKHVHGVINGAFIHLLFVTQDLTILPRSPLWQEWHLLTRQRATTTLGRTRAKWLHAVWLSCIIQTCRPALFASPNVGWEHFWTDGDYGGMGSDAIWPGRRTAFCRCERYVCHHWWNRTRPHHMAFIHDFIQCWGRWWSLGRHPMEKKIIRCMVPWSQGPSQSTTWQPRFWERNGFCAKRGQEQGDEGSDIWRLYVGCLGLATGGLFHSKCGFSVY